MANGKNLILYGLFKSIFFAIFTWITLCTDTFWCPRDHGTDSIWSTFQSWAAWIQILWTFTSCIWISNIASITLTSIWLSVFTMGVSSTSWVTNWGSNGRHTKMIRVPYKTFSTNTRFCICITLCVETTIFSTTCINTSSIFTSLRPKIE